MDTYKKLKMALSLEKEFTENENLKETWMGITKSENGQLIIRVAQVEEKRYEVAKDIKLVEEDIKEDEK